MTRTLKQIKETTISELSQNQIKTKDDIEFTSISESITYKLKTKLEHFKSEHIDIDEMMMDTARGSDMQMRQGGDESKPQVHIVHKDSPNVPIKSGSVGQIHAHTLDKKSGFNPKIHRIVVGRVNAQGNISESNEVFSDIEKELNEALGDGAKRLLGAAVLAGAIGTASHVADQVPPSTIWHEKKQYTVLRQEPSTPHKDDYKTITIKGVPHRVYGGNTVLPVSALKK